ncbi:GNAT family N-acetyltransferase [Actinoplanes philippinensis]|uniref:GNAT family N-acetyltransferase n=1 Tax=Actinoplanes philippinensis TaxID=35752 RepID=UPI0033E50D76
MRAESSRHILTGASTRGSGASVMIGSWPQLEGPLVRLRPPVPGDEPALIEMATDALVRRYIGGPADLATATAKATRKTTAPDPGEFVIIDCASGEVAGSGSLARKRGPWEISYMLRRSFWGRGLATQTVLLIRDGFFTHTTEDLLIATTQRANEGSRRVLQRAGGVFAGAFDQYGMPQERYEFHRSAGT